MAKVKPALKAMPPPPPQRWLAGETSYQKFANSLCHSDPRLRNRDTKAITQKIPWDNSGVRAVSLDLGVNNTFGEAMEFATPEELDAQLARTISSAESLGASSPPDKKAAVSGGQIRRTVWILEGLGPGFVAAFGSRFGLHPSMFVEHERVVVMNKRPDGESDGIPLPSALQARDHVCLKYFEVLRLDRRPTSFRLTCADTGRHIGVARDDGEFKDAMIVRRKCSFWSRKHADGGWDCLVICDPPVKRVRTGEEYRDEYPVKTSPYQGGYVDFVPQEAQVRARSSIRPGPPRTSMLDDLVFYLQEHAAQLLTPLSAAGAEADAGCRVMAEPDTVVGSFVRKIVASQYLRHAEHVRAILSQVQRALSRKHDLASLPMAKVEELWTDTQAWERRVGEYCEDLESIMLQLAIPLDQPDLSPAAAAAAAAAAVSPSTSSCPRDALFRWLDPRLDFQFLLLRFSELRHRIECLNAAVTGLASITGNRQAHAEQQLALETARRSTREAKRTKAVTLVGLVFIPLAYTSSVYSMTEPFAPGGDKFAEYWAVSIPLIVVVLLMYYALDLGYTDDGSDGTSWSPRVFLLSVRARLWWIRPDEDRVIIEAKSAAGPL